MKFISTFWERLEEFILVAAVCFYGGYELPERSI